MFYYFAEFGVFNPFDLEFFLLYFLDLLLVIIFFIFSTSFSMGSMDEQLLAPSPSDCTMTIFELYNSELLKLCFFNSFFLCFDFGDLGDFCDFDIDSAFSSFLFFFFF